MIFQQFSVVNFSWVNFLDEQFYIFIIIAVACISLSLLFMIYFSLLRPLQNTHTQTRSETKKNRCNDNINFYRFVEALERRPHKRFFLIATLYIHETPKMIR